MYNTLSDIFTFDMVSLIDETVTVITFEMLPIWPLVFYLALDALVVTTILLLRKIKVSKVERRSTMNFMFKNLTIVFMTLCMAVYSLVCVGLQPKDDDDLYLVSDYMLYRTFSSTRQSLIKFGSYGFYFEELCRKFLDYEPPLEYSMVELDAYVNSREYDPTKLSLFNVAEGSNVIVLMCESLEWYAISSETTPTLYALANGYDFGDNYEYFNFYEFETDDNGFTTLSRTDYDYDAVKKTYQKNANELFADPEMFGEYGLTLTNYYSKAKTDYSETSVILGNYPYNESYTSHGGLLGYGSSNLYSDINYGFSLPNMLVNSGAVDEANYMHSYYSTFYGRDKLLPQFGFQNTLFLDQFSDKIETGDNLSHIVLDSKVLDYYLNIATEQPFISAGEKFINFFTTVTTHGEYDYNPLLEQHYEFIDSIDYLGKTENGSNDLGLTSELSGIVKSYLASVLDLEYGVTLLVKYLMENDLFEDTLLVLFSDHQSYYNNLDLDYKKWYFTEDEKGYSSAIEWERGVKYKEEYGMANPDRFKVPAIIYSTKITDSVVGSGDDAHYVDKLTCAFDITPTIFTLLGVDYNPSLYMGYPVICDVYDADLGIVVDLGVSAIISHTGNVFNDRITTIDGLEVVYTKKNVSESEINEFTYSVVKQLEKWYKITALYEKNMFVRD